MVTELNAAEARAATKRPHEMILVLIVSLMLADVAVLTLAVGRISLPWGT